MGLETISSYFSQIEHQMGSLSNSSFLPNKRVDNHLLATQSMRRLARDQFLRQVNPFWTLTTHFLEPPTYTQQRRRQRTFHSSFQLRILSKTVIANQCVSVCQRISKLSWSWQLKISYSSIQDSLLYIIFQKILKYTFCAHELSRCRKKLGIVSVESNLNWNDLVTALE